jgi:hypothetical protein
VVMDIEIQEPGRSGSGSPARSMSSCCRLRVRPWWPGCGTERPSRSRR